MPGRLISVLRIERVPFQQGGVVPGYRRPPQKRRRAYPSARSCEGGPEEPVR